MAPNPAPVFTQTLTTKTGVPTCLLTTDTHIISGLSDGTVSIISHDLQDERILEIGSFAVWSICLVPSSGSTYLAVGCSEGSLSIWDIEKGEKKMDFIGHTATPRCIKVLKDGRLVSSGRDATLRIWKLDFEKGEGACEKVLEGHEASIREFAVYENREGKARIFSISYDTTARIWDPETGSCLSVLRDHKNKIYTVVVDEERRWAATGGIGGEAKIWDLEKEECIKEMSVLPRDIEKGKETNILASKLAFMNLGGKEVLLTGDNLGGLKCFNVKTDGKWDMGDPAHQNSIVSMAADQENERLITGGSDGIIRLWELKSGIIGQELGEGGEAVWKVAVLKGHGQGKIVAAVARESRVVLEVFELGLGKSSE